MVGSRDGSRGGPRDGSRGRFRVDSRDGSRDDSRDDSMVGHPTHYFRPTPSSLPRLPQTHAFKPTPSSDPRLTQIHAFLRPTASDPRLPQMFVQQEGIKGTTSSEKTKLLAYVGHGRYLLKSCLFCCGNIWLVKYVTGMYVTLDEGKYDYLG